MTVIGLSALLVATGKAKEVGIFDPRIEAIDRAIPAYRDELISRGNFE